MRGDAHHKTKLLADQRARIAEMHGRGLSASAIAKVIGVHKSTVCRFLKAAKVG